MTCRSCSLMSSCKYVISIDNLDKTKICADYVCACDGCFQNGKPRYLNDPCSSCIHYEVEPEKISLGKLMGELWELKYNQLQLHHRQGVSGKDLDGINSVVDAKQKQIDSLIERAIHE